MIIAIDFDGTIVQDLYPCIGVMQPYAKQVINKLRDDGHYVIIWTCRAGDKLLDAVNFLLNSGIGFDRVNDHDPKTSSQYDISGKKISADVYIDDKNLGGFPGWLTVESLLLKKNEDQL